MTDDKIDFYDLQKRLKDLGMSDSEIDSVIENEGSNVHLLTFTLDDKESNIISYHKGTIVFISPKYPGKVNVGETWFCSLEKKTRSYHAVPMYKVTPTLLLNLDAELREGLIDSLWEKNRSMFESDFAQRYRDEIHTKAVEEVRSEMQSIIDGLKSDVGNLQNQLEQNRILNMSSSVSGPSMIELGSDDALPTENARAPATPSVPIEEIPHIPSIPGIRASAPGMPEMRAPGIKSSEPRSVVYDVTRTAEETIYSESFTDPKYFVHISPDCRMLVIRPSSFGTALCFNKRIRLQGLGSLSPFTEKKKLMAEYSSRYEGMIVYL